MGNLIKMPYGCGEQNMINFAPNVFALQYLKHSGQENEDVTRRASYFIRNGKFHYFRFCHIMMVLNTSQCFHFEDK